MTQDWVLGVGAVGRQGQELRWSMLWAPGGRQDPGGGLATLTLGGLFPQITAQQIAAQGQPQKVTYATQPALKTQFLTTPISQAQKLAGTQQVQTQIQVSRGSLLG